MPKTTAAQFVARLRETSDDYHFDRIDYETFTARQFATWREIESRSERMADRVHAMLRND